MLVVVDVLLNKTRLSLKFPKIGKKKTYVVVSLVVGIDVVVVSGVKVVLRLENRLNLSVLCSFSDFTWLLTMS